MYLGLPAVPVTVVEENYHLACKQDWWLQGVQKIIRSGVCKVALRVRRVGKRIWYVLHIQVKYRVITHRWKDNRHEHEEEEIPCVEPAPSVCGALQC